MLSSVSFSPDYVKHFIPHLQPPSSEDHVAPSCKPAQEWPTTATKSNQRTASEAHLNLPWLAHAPDHHCP